MEEGKTKRKVSCYRGNEGAARWFDDPLPSRPVHQESV